MIVSASVQIAGEQHAGKCGVSMPENLLLSGMPADERRALAPYLEEDTMKAGQQLIEVDRPIEHVWFPHDAVTSTIVDTPEGATVEVGLMGLEGMVGLSLLLDTDVSNTTVVVQIEGRGARMRTDHFLERVVRTGGQLYKGLLRYTNAFMAMIAQTAACNGLHGIDQRLARWILMIHDRVQREDMALTQEFLAYMLGVRRASVSIAASALQAAGLIKYSRGHLTIVDRKGLEEASCACYVVTRRLMRGSLEKKLSV